MLTSRARAADASAAAAVRAAEVAMVAGGVAGVAVPGPIPGRPCLAACGVARTHGNNSGTNPTTHHSKPMLANQESRHIRLAQCQALPTPTMRKLTSTCK